jgi:hypothetical protein
MIVVEGHQISLLQFVMQWIWVGQGRFFRRPEKKTGPVIDALVMAKGSGGDPPPWP